MKGEGMARTIVRMWTADGYHKDVVFMDEIQVRMQYDETKAKPRHWGAAPVEAVRVVIDPKLFPEAVEFEVIVERTDKC